MYNSTFKYMHTSLASKFSNSKGRMTVQHKIPNEWHKQQHKNIHYYLSNLSTSEHKKWKHINIEGDIMQCAISCFLIWEFWLEKQVANAAMKKLGTLFKIKWLHPVKYNAKRTNKSICNVVGNTCNGRKCLVLPKIEL